MEVVRAKKAGACYGVQRALDLAARVVEEGGSVYTLGPLIHNPQVVHDLEAKGARVVDDAGQLAGKSGTVVVRSHGVTPAVRRSLDSMDFSVVDATCPHVSRAQNAAAELAGRGCRVIVVGEAGHPEVESLVAYAREAGGAVDVVADASQIPADVSEPVGVVSQTTQMRESLASVVRALEDRGLSPEVKNTICSATRSRQDYAADLSREVDAMVVIGGRNSSNTTRLYEICAASCPKSYHVESAEELDPSWFSGCGVVGVTAGASTPESQIAEVCARLEGF